jgi:hypothetical protein
LGGFEPGTATLFCQSDPQDPAAGPSTSLKNGVSLTFAVGAFEPG